MRRKSAACWLDGNDELGHAYFLVMGVGYDIHGSQVVHASVLYILLGYISYNILQRLGFLRCAVPRSLVDNSRATVDIEFKAPLIVTAIISK